MIIFCYSLSNNVGVFIHFEGEGILMIDFNIDCCFIHFCRKQFIMIILYYSSLNSGCAFIQIVGRDLK